MSPTHSPKQAPWTAGQGWFFERRGCRVYRSEMHRGRHIKVADIAVLRLTEEDLKRVGHLIAAAPELYEALKTARDYVTDAIANADDPNVSVGLSMRQMMADDLATIDSALSKARPSNRGEA